MRVRVFDQARKCYFKSEVYAIINSGYYERQLVLVPGQAGGYFKFFDYLDKSKPMLPVLINMILPQRPDSWIFKRANSVDEALIPYQSRLPQNVRFFEFCGFQWLWENVDTLTRLLNGESIPVQDSSLNGKLYSDILQTGWSFVETQKDADALMKEVHGFHDSVIKELRYISGAFVANDKSMMPVEDIKSVRMEIQSQQCPSFEMEFQGVTALNLRPAADNFTGNMLDASIMIQDESIFFSNSFMEHIDLTYEGTWITSYSLKWRYIE